MSYPLTGASKQRPSRPRRAVDQYARQLCRSELGGAKWRTSTLRPARRAIAKGPQSRISLSKIKPEARSAHSRRNAKRLIGPRARAIRRWSREFDKRTTGIARTIGERLPSEAHRTCGEALPRPLSAALSWRQNIATKKDGRSTRATAHKRDDRSGWGAQ